LAEGALELALRRLRLRVLREDRADLPRAPASGHLIADAPYVEQREPLGSFECVPKPAEREHPGEVDERPGDGRDGKAVLHDALDPRAMQPHTAASLRSAAHRHVHQARRPRAQIPDRSRSAMAQHRGRTECERRREHPAAWRHGWSQRQDARLHAIQPPVFDTAANHLLGEAGRVQLRGRHHTMLPRDKFRQFPIAR